jgi:hypothetical protein
MDMAAAIEETKNKPPASSHACRCTKTTCLLALILSANGALAQRAQRQAALRATTTETSTRAVELPGQTPSASPALSPPALKISPAVPTKISYVGGQLKIDAFDSTLADVLTSVSTLTGVSIDIPASARTERMPVVELGPGTARQVLAALLSDSTFDYLIQSSSTDPDMLQSVLLMPREKKGAGSNTAEARPLRSPYARQPEAPVPDPPAQPQPDVAAPEAIALNPSPAAPQADPPPTSAAALPNQPMLAPAQPDASGITRPGALAPPQSLNSQSIKQQLQQMYQQRMQMSPATQSAGRQ